MAHYLFTYELSQEADNDLDNIYDYSVGHFGFEQADKYLLGFELVFENLCVDPKLGRERSEFWKDLRSISYQSHIVFYRILKHKIRIVRVLHGSRDIIKFLPPQD